MKIRLLIYILGLGIMLPQVLYGQDLHYSQYSIAPWQLNPAHTGLFQGNYRFALQHRQQYKSVPVPYSTISAGGDFQRKLNKRPGIFWTGGLIINNDQAGDAHYRQTQFLPTLGLIKKIGKDSIDFISLAFRPGWIFTGVDPGLMTFESQFNGDGYDASMSSGESFTDRRFSAPDFSLGFAWNHFNSERNQITTGLSLMNIIKPKDGYLQNATQWRSRRINVFASITTALNSRIDLLPEMMLQFQNKFWEATPGTRLRFWLPDGKGAYYGLYAGLHYRLRDALLVSAQLDYGAWRGGISYDITMSSLRNANNSRGGFELHLIYLFRKIEIPKPGKKICPVYL
jgi:type IX secretion system PorP/SprF family membrane protein